MAGEMLTSVGKLKRERCVHPTHLARGRMERADMGRYREEIQVERKKIAERKRQK